MTVSVASRPVYSLNGISEQARIVLGFVDGGAQWLEWAIRDPGAQYYFEDDGALVAGVQSGLHAWPLLLLPTNKLIVGPVKLMTISLADLRTLQLVELGNGGKTASARAAQISGEAGLVTLDQLAAGVALLDQWKLNGKPMSEAALFQCLGFPDQLAMYGLLNDPGEPGLEDYQQEAAGFAAAQAVTPVEFCDYFRAYLQQIHKAATLKETPDQRAALVQDAVETLLPLLFGALDCPRVEGLVAPWEVNAAIEEWLMMGRQLGFARLSLAVQQVIANTPYQAQGGMDAQAIVHSYLDGAQALLRSTKLGRGQVGQDGVSCAFSLSSNGSEAAVQLGADGIVTLASYVPPSPPSKPEK